MMKAGLAFGLGALALGALAFGVLGGKVGAGTPGLTVLARMGEVRVDTAELGALLDIARGAGAKEEAVALPALASAVREEALRKALLAQAEAAGLPQRPGIAARVRRAGEQVLIEAWLAERAAPAADYPPATLARAYYDANRSAFVVPNRYRLAQIWLPRPQQDAQLPEARKEAQRIGREAAAAGADFAALAAAHSRHAQTAGRGGLLGWVPEHLLRPELREPVARLEPGQVSGPVELDDGWHIVRLEAREAAHTLSFEAARGQIDTALRNEQAAANRAAYVEGLVRDSPVTVDELALEDFSTARQAAKPSR